MPQFMVGTAPAAFAGSPSSQLLGLRKDIDDFLDPNLLGPLGASIGFLQPQSPPDADISPLVSIGQSSSELQRLSRTNEELQQALEGARQEVKAKSKAISCLNSAQRGQLGHARQESTELREDGQTKKRRLSEVEDELLKLRRERESLANEVRELQERSSHNLEALELRAAEDCRRRDIEIARLESQLQGVPGLQDGPIPAQARVLELEEEVIALRMLLKEWWPEKELATRLQSKHLKLDGELQQLQSARAELLAARERVIALEQSQASLQAALNVRDAALKETREAHAAAETSKQDLIGYEAVAAEVLTVAKDLNCEVPVKPTLMNLRLAWSFLQSHWAKEGHSNLQKQRLLDAAADQQKDSQMQLSKMRLELSAALSNAAEVKGKLQEAESEVLRLRAQSSVLREALAGKNPDLEKAFARPELEQKAQQDLQIETVTKEAEALRDEVSRLRDAEAKARKLERVNAELWQANKELEVRVERLESADVDNADYDPRVTKVLHLAGGPSRQTEAKGSGGDLEQQQAARQLDRFKKAMRKYVQEFREGIYHLLGWKVEMKGDGSTMRWHLTSRYHDGQELVFQLRAASTGHPAEFDLLGTPWAEHLQDDRQAMAYLEVYSSIPGFLAHVTVDRLAQQTFTR